MKAANTDIAKIQYYRPFPIIGATLIKFCVVFCCLVVVSFVMMCETYSKEKKKFTKAEHKEILEYARSRYVVCM